MLNAENVATNLFQIERRRKMEQREAVKVGDKFYLVIARTCSICYRVFSVKQERCPEHNCLLMPVLDHKPIEEPLK